MKNKPQIAASFAAAAARYDAASHVQRLAARRLAGRITGDWRDPGVLDVGAGTGHLAQAIAEKWPAAHIVLADLAAPMLHRARGKLPWALAAVADAEALPFADGVFDIAAANCALQWCDDPARALKGMARLLRPGGVLAATCLLAGTWAEWCCAHQALGLVPSMQSLPDLESLRARVGFADRIDVETVLRPYRQGREFLREIGALGAGVRARPALPPADLARVVGAFERAGPLASYEIATVLLRRPARAGVVVAGTGTGVGKTVVAAILAHAWGAEYWKPAQTGLAQDPGDDAALRRLGVATHPCRFALAAPLSPAAAAAREGVAIAVDDFRLPVTSRPLVVETAGGVASPLDPLHDMADLATHLGLPAVLVTRSELGTITHTLTALARLRACGVTVLFVAMVGPPNPGNRDALARRGNVPVLLEVPTLARIDRETISHAAAGVPSLAELGWTNYATRGWFSAC